MKMARARQEDLDAAMKVSGRLEDLWRGHMPYMGDESEDLEFFDRDDEVQCKRALHAILDAADRGNMFRVIFGMEVVCDPRNKVIDPDADTLEVHPEHLTNAEKVTALTARVAELEKDLTKEKTMLDWVIDHDGDFELHTLEDEPQYAVWMAMSFFFGSSFREAIAAAVEKDAALLAKGET